MDGVVYAASVQRRACALETTDWMGISSGECVNPECIHMTVICKNYKFISQSFLVGHARTIKAFFVVFSFQAKFQEENNHQMSRILLVRKEWKKKIELFAWKGCSRKVVRHVKMKGINYTLFKVYFV